MQFPLAHRISLLQEGQATPNVLLDEFLGFVKDSKLELYPSQEEAILELYADKNVILNTPTGSGKSLVATAVHFLSLGTGKKSVYTSPIKALVNEKFLALCRTFGPENVGMATGDASVNPDAPILCCTAEILSNRALRDGKEAPFHDIIIDEFHYYSDRDRGAAWQIPLLTLPNCRFLLMSATLGDTEVFQRRLTALNGKETLVVQSNHRPVPLEFKYAETHLHETVATLIDQERYPLYLVCFSQRECAEEAQNFVSIDLCSRVEKAQIQELIYDVRFTSPYGKEIHRLLKNGIGIHHAGLLPKYRILVEKLAQKGLLKLICGTDTLGVGVNIPIRTVLFTKLCKYDGEKTALLTIRDFLQISGRAGRKGFDNKGYVVAQAPEYVIDNLRMEQKAAKDPKKARKFVKRRPPERGFVPWTKETFQKMIHGKPEPLISRFKVNHAMLLNVLSRPNEDGCRAMQKLVKDCHESDYSKKKHRKVAFQYFRSLVDRKIIEFNPLRVNVDLQEDFSLNHALSLYLLDALRLLNPENQDYCLDVLTLVESILENPEMILRKQVDKVKTLRIAELKEEGVPFEERMEQLEKLEHPKPLRNFIYDTFNDFAANHPWIGEENIHPKSIAREMFETFQSFSEYVREYQIHRSEGLLLRYLSDVYRTMVQNVPSSFKTEEVEGVIEYFGTMIREIDSSLLDEWERIRDPNWIKAEISDAADSPKARMQPNLNNRGDSAYFATLLRMDTREFSVLLRNEIFRLVRALSRRDFESVLEVLDPAKNFRPESIATKGQHTWTVHKLEERLNAYRSAGHARISTDTEARSKKFVLIDKEEIQQRRAPFWEVQQILTDPEEHNDWALTFRVDLEESFHLKKPSIQLLKIDTI